MNFAQAAEAAMDAAFAEWRRFCESVADDARTRAPAGHGVLRGSLRAETRRAGDAAEGTVAAEAPHAVYVHEGTGVYHPRGRRTRWVYPAGGGRFFSTEGQPAVPFLRDAVEAARAALARETDR